MACGDASTCGDALAHGDAMARTEAMTCGDAMSRAVRSCTPPRGPRARNQPEATDAVPGREANIVWSAAKASETIGAVAWKCGVFGEVGRGRTSTCLARGDAMTRGGAYSGGATGPAATPPTPPPDTLPDGCPDRTHPRPQLASPRLDNALELPPPVYHAQVGLALPGHAEPLLLLEPPRWLLHLRVLRQRVLEGRARNDQTWQHDL